MVVCRYYAPLHICICGFWICSDKMTSSCYSCYFLFQCTRLEQELMARPTAAQLAEFEQLKTSNGLTYVHIE